MTPVKIDLTKFYALGNATYNVMPDGALRLVPKEIEAIPGSFLDAEPEWLGRLKNGRLVFDRVKISPLGPGKINSRYEKWLSQSEYMRSRTPLAFPLFDQSVHFTPWANQWTKDGVYRLCPIGPFASRLVEGTPKYQVEWFGGCPVPRGMVPEEEKSLVDSMRSLRDQMAEDQAIKYRWHLEKKAYKKATGKDKGTFEKAFRRVTKEFGRVVEKVAEENPIAWARSGLEHTSAELRRSGSKISKEWKRSADKLGNEVQRWVDDPYVRASMIGLGAVLLTIASAGLLGSVAGSLVSIGIEPASRLASAASTQRFVRQLQKETTKKEIAFEAHLTEQINRAISELEGQRYDLILAQIPLEIRRGAMKASELGISDLQVRGMLVLAKRVEEFIRTYKMAPSQEWTKNETIEIVEKIQKETQSALVTKNTHVVPPSGVPQISKPKKEPMGANQPVTLIGLAVLAYVLLGR